ncbi:MAG: hypothetical protein PUF31_08790 [Oscillospiraceae bacterium]|nr:hypothetical protein [Oscillospiraceae bacterium]
MYRPNGLRAVFKLLAGLMIFVATFITATPDNINIDNVTLQVSQLTTQSTEFEFSFTNHSPYAIQHEPDNVKLERLDGDTWSEMELNPFYLDNVYIMLARPFLDDSILPGETFTHHFQLSLLFPDKPPLAGTYRLTVEYKTQKIYSLKNISTIAESSCEFTVVEA